MALTIRSTSKTGLAKFTVNMRKGQKSTETIHCNRSEAKDLILKVVRMNGNECEFVSILINGKLFILN